MAIVSLVNIFAVIVWCGVVMATTCYQPQDFHITCPDTNACTSGYAVNGVLGGPINMTRGNGCTYNFILDGNQYSKIFAIYRNGNSPRSGSQFPAGGSGTISFDPSSQSGSGSLQVNTAYWYSYCSSTNPTTCPGGVVNVFDVPKDGNWGPWTGCTKSCGGGVYTRSCSAPQPANGGTDCVGNSLSDVECHTVPCGCRIDVMYVLDGSGSIGDASWGFLQTFAVDLSAQVDIGNGSTAGVVQFSNAAETRFETDLIMPPIPRMIGDLGMIDYVITHMAKFGHSTAIGTGLLFGQDGLHQAGRWGLDPPVPKVILLITDGTNHDGPIPGPVAQRIKANGTEIFVIGVGGEFDYAVLDDLASEPKDGVHYFNISSYEALNEITNDLAYELCYSRGGSAPPSLYLLFLLLLPLAAGIGFIAFIWRRRKPKKAAPPPPEPEPEPVPVKAAAPAPVVDKPKDWTVPGTRYIGFGQANIKVKWGTDAPPSAPRGHDKYDRWSMQHGGGPLPPSAGASNETPMLSAETEAPAPAASGAAEPSCCARFCPCCLPLFGGGGASKDRAQIAKNNNADEGSWQENTAASAGASSSPKEGV